MEQRERRATRYVAALAGLCLVVLAACAAVFLPAVSFAEPDQPVLRADDTPSSGEPGSTEPGQVAGDELSSEATPQQADEALAVEPDQPDDVSEAGEEPPGGGSSTEPDERDEDDALIQVQAVSGVSSAAELRAALAAAAGTTATITIAADIDMAGDAGYLYVPANSDIALVSPGGHTLKAAGGSTSHLFSYAGAGGSLTLGAGLTIDCNARPLVSVYSDCELVVDGAKVTNGGGSLSLIAATTSGSKFVMKGGEVSGCTSTSAAGVISIANGGAMEMTGGTIRECVSSYSGGPDYVTGVPIRVMSGASLSMSGGTIQGCKGPAGGAIQCYNGGAKVTMSGGAIDGCEATAGFGGAVYILGGGSFTMAGGALSNNKASECGGGVSVSTGGSFTLDGGTITGNQAGCGGGVYTGGSEEVYLLSGNITDNRSVNGPSLYATGTGGGVGVGSITATSTSGIHMVDVIVTGNSAGTIGGGAWLCPTGDVDSEISDGVAMYGNTAAHAGDDLAITNYTSGAVHKVDVIQGRMLGGGVAERYHDGTPQGTTNNNQGDGSGARYRDGRRDLFDYAQWDGMSALALHNEASEGAKELATQRARLYITGNTSENAGGGIASNGHVWVGKAESKRVVVKKVWGLPEGAQALAEVRVKLEIDGASDGMAREVEEVTLNAANGWTHTFEGLPVKARVNLEEAEVSAPGWVSHYKEGFSGERAIADAEADEAGTEQTVYYELETVDVTNAREGTLTIGKQLQGDLADPDREFSFEVTILNPDDPLDQAEVDDQSGERLPYGPYEGRDAQHHVAPLDFAYAGSVSGTLRGGTGVISLKGGQSVTLTGLPHGAWYRVREVARAADGYEIEPVRDDGAVGHAAEQGTIAGDTRTVLTYTNARDSGMGSLEVSKTVEDDAADAGRLYHFQVMLYHPDGTELTEGEFAYLGAHEGIVGSGAQFALAAGESVHIDGIPRGTRYKLVEVDPGGYEPRYYDAEGTIEGPGTTHARIVNALPAAKVRAAGRSPQTGDPMSVVFDLSAGICAAAALCCLVSFAIYRRETPYE